jgi:protein O-mannosyl-transferase
LKSFNIKLLAIILIPCLGIVVYANTFLCSFHYDDLFFIVNNSFITHIQNPLNIWKIFPTRFVTFFTFALNYHCHQFNVFGYHLFNLAVHLCSAILVWWLTLLTFSTPAFEENSAKSKQLGLLKGQKMTRHADVIALLAGLVFVSHPVQTEAVTYIWQRVTSMAALFYLASLSLYVKSRLVPDTGRALSRGMFYYICSLMIAIMAMFTKEMTVTLPFMILFYEISFLKTKGNFNGGHIIPFFLTLWIIPLTIVLAILPTRSVSFWEVRSVIHGLNGISSVHYFLTQLRVMVTYIRLVFLPLHQNLDYDYPVSKTIFEIPVLASLSFLILVLFWAKRIFSKYRLISFSIFWFFLTLLPESSFLPFKDVIVEHRLYLPMAGYSIFLVSSMYYLWGKRSLKTMVIVLVGIITCYSVLTYQRNRVWKDDITLWNDTVGKSPHKARAYANRGVGYDRQGEYAKAMVDFNKAIDIDPQLAEAYISRSSLYAQQGKIAQALSDYDTIIKLMPDDGKTYYSRSVIYAQQGHWTRAIEDLNKAIELNPNYEEAYNNRGGIYAKQDELIPAIFDLNKAIEINPEDTDTYNNRYVVYTALTYKMEKYDILYKK